MKWFRQARDEKISDSGEICCFDKSMEGEKGHCVQKNYTVKQNPLIKIINLTN